MILYNSLNKKPVELKLLKEGEVSLYTCGPTVYDHAHIGNLRTYIFEDTLRRVLSACDLEVRHVMNLTDIDDKTIARSRALYPELNPMEALRKLTKEYEQRFLADADLLGIDFDNSKIARATEKIESMQKLIRMIPNRYITDDGVYFDITKQKDYGVFVKLDQSHTHHRIRNDEYDKDHVADFVLWKAHKDGEPSWDFEIDGSLVPGRPGWHLECSAMAGDLLGVPFDIHTGGVDLKFPHHENEIAQTTAATGKKLAHVFLHTEHLLVDGKKMSKSLKNYYTLEDLTEKGFDPIAFRLLVLQSHYRSQMNFTWEALQASQNRLNHWRSIADLRWQKESSTDFPSLLELMKNDIDTPKALAAVDSFFASHVPDDGALKTIHNLLGVDLQGPDIDKAQKKLLANRQKAREEQNWSRSDELRDLLNDQGIGVRDSDQGQQWYRL